MGAKTVSQKTHERTESSHVSRKKENKNILKHPKGKLSFFDPEIPNRFQRLKGEIAQFFRLEARGKSANKISHRGKAPFIRKETQTYPKLSF